MAFGIFNPDTGKTRRLGLLQRPGVVGALGSQPPVAIEENPQASRGPKLPSLPELASQPGITEPGPGSNRSSPFLDPQDKPPDFRELLAQAILGMGAPSRAGSSLISSQQAQRALDSFDERARALEQAGVPRQAIDRAREREQQRIHEQFLINRVPFNERPIQHRVS